MRKRALGIQEDEAGDKQLPFKAALAKNRRKRKQNGKKSITDKLEDDQNA